MVKPTILEVQGDPDLALVYVARFREEPGYLVEFVDAIDPRYPREDKWAVTVATQFGCPVGCRMCDSGGYYMGNLSVEEIFAEIDHVISSRVEGDKIACPKLKIHFARMGEPALNPNLLDVLEQLPHRYDAPGLMPCIPTTAPKAAAEFFEKLLPLKQRLYSGGHFQLQFSLNSTDPAYRDWLMPVPKWSLEQIAAYGRRFYEPGDRRVVLNFAFSPDCPFDPEVISRTFDPEHFMVKLTPINPTDMAVSNEIDTLLSPDAPDAADKVIEGLKREGFLCVVSIGAPEEIEIGSNCGQAVARWRRSEAAAVRKQQREQAAQTG